MEALSPGQDYPSIYKHERVPTLVMGHF
jgi:hypothetical protein